MLLFISACARKDSRTRRIAQALLSHLHEEVTEVNLCEMPLLPMNEERLEKRTALLACGKYDDEMFALARQFAKADTVVIAAPYWDYSFPAVLKTYLENIYAVGIVSRYSENGVPIGLCRAKKLWYVTTAGGPYLPDFSFDYVTRLAKDCFGIPETELVSAEMLDVFPKDAENILSRVIEGLSDRGSAEANG